MSANSLPIVRQYSLIAAVVLVRASAPCRNTCRFKVKRRRCLPIAFGKSVAQSTCSAGTSVGNKVRKLPFGPPTVTGSAGVSQTAGVVDTTLPAVSSASTRPMLRGRTAADRPSPRGLPDCQSAFLPQRNDMFHHAHIVVWRAAAQNDVAGSGPDVVD